MLSQKPLLDGLPNVKSITITDAPLSNDDMERLRSPSKCYDLDLGVSFLRVAFCLLRLIYCFDKDITACDHGQTVLIVDDDDVIGDEES